MAINIQKRVCTGYEKWIKQFFMIMSYIASKLQAGSLIFGHLNHEHPFYSPSIPTDLRDEA